MTTTRSGGTQAVKGLPYIVGGGYKGATEELDATVVRAAQMLEEAFGRDVQIRFNSNRLSGGAWIKDSLPAFSGSCAVGLCAGFHIVWPEDMTQEERWATPRSEWEKLPIEVRLSTMIKPVCLRDEDLLNEGSGENRYAYHYHASLEDGLAFLRANVVTANIPGLLALAECH